MAVPESSRAFMARQIERLRARKQKPRIVMPEGSDPRIVAAAARLAELQLAEPILVCSPAIPAPAGVCCTDFGSRKLLDKYAQIYFERRKSRGISVQEAHQIAARPLYFCNLMLAAGDADGFVGGASNTTADTVRAALQCVGTEPHVKTVSGVYLVGVHDRSYGHDGMLAMADPAIVIDPTASQLAEIAIATAGTTRCLFDAEPVVALLSFSTKGSGGKHPLAEKVLEALRYIRARAPELHCDGELQVDAALVPSVGQSKAPGSTVAGRANTLIFPGIDAANIGVKLVERLGGGDGMGPFLQGLAKPANDLSRGCSAETIFNVAVITALQTGGD